MANQNDASSSPDGVGSSEQDSQLPLSPELLASLTPVEMTELILSLSEQMVAANGNAFDEPVPLTPAGQEKPFDRESWLRTVRT